MPNITKIKQNQSKPHENYSPSIKINEIYQTHTNSQQKTSHKIAYTSNKNQCKYTKINPNHTYMHHNLQRRRKSKSNSLLHILGLLVSHVWSRNLHSWSLARARARARVSPRRFVLRCPEELLHMARETRAGGVYTTSEVNPRLAKRVLFLSPNTLINSKP